MGMMNEESVWIGQILAGEVEIYRLIVERYQTGLIIYCENILKDRSVAEDMSQEAFIKAYSQLGSFKVDKASFSTWLYRIARNICLDYIRKNKRTINFNDIEAIIGADSPEHMKEEEFEQLRGLIDELDPPKYSEVIKGYYWEGKSYQVLAKEHETSTNTIGTWLKRAKAQLKERLS